MMTKKKANSFLFWFQSTKDYFLRKIKIWNYNSFIEYKNSKYIKKEGLIDMDKNDMFSQKLKELGYDNMPKGFLLIRWKK